MTVCTDRVGIIFPSITTHSGSRVRKISVFFLKKRTSVLLILPCERVRPFWPGQNGADARQRRSNCTAPSLGPLHRDRPQQGLICTSAYTRLFSRSLLKTHCRKQGSGGFSFGGSSGGSSSVGGGFSSGVHAVEYVER